MRHRVKGKKISRKKAHRKQTLRDLSNALIREHRIVTTLAKAKALRPFFEPLVTRAKEDTQHNRRQVFSTLNNKHTVKKLFDEVGPEAQGRPGGYTRIVRYGYRKGDGAQMAIIELVDYNDIKPEQDQKKQKKTRRAGRKKKTTSAQSAQESSGKSDSDQQTKDQPEDSQKASDTGTEESVDDTTEDDAQAQQQSEKDADADNQSASKDTEADEDTQGASAQDQNAESGDDSSETNEEKSKN
jgi:large subunit ribosomal protein L17